MSLLNDTQPVIDSLELYRISQPVAILIHLRDNILPSGSERAQIRRSLETARAWLSDHVHTGGTVNEPEVAVIRQYISHYSSLIAPIRRLFPDLLTRILLDPSIHGMFWMSKFKKRQSMYERPIVVPGNPHAAEVSHYWRAVSLASPQFWSSFNITACGRGDRGPDSLRLLSLYLQRSQDAPLSFQLDYVDTPVLPLLARLMQDAERWKHVELQPSVMPHIAAVHGRLHILETLVVSRHSNTGEYLSTAFGGAPQLRTLSVWSINNPTLPGSSIRNLTVGNLDSASWQIVCSLQTLECLAIQLESEYSLPHPERPPAPHHNISAIHLSSSSTNIFHHLNTKSTSLLEISGIRDWIHPPIQLFLQRSGCVLHELVLTDSRIPVPELVSLLRILPTLRSLSLADMPGLAVSDVLFRSLIVDQARPTLLPEMTRLVMEGDYFGSTPSILTMLESRTQPHMHCAPLNVVEIYISRRKLALEETARFGALALSRFDLKCQHKLKSGTSLVTTITTVVRNGGNIYTDTVVTTSADSM
ncbi:hypothetical protein C8J57DRAFT_1733836 [Mycena rebaudengoi]|nr:hypothetical protein C8J57DRAFT_1733836 [Mycena rebaudengoi]